MFSVRIDKNRKLPITTFIRSLLRLRDDVTVEQINADVNNALTDLRGTDEAMRPCWRFTASCVPASPPPSNRP